MQDLSAKIVDYQYIELKGVWGTFCYYIYSH